MRDADFRPHHLVAQPSPRRSSGIVRLALTRRGFLGGIAALAALAACGAPTRSPGATATKPPVTPTPRPRVLRAMLGREPDSLAAFPGGRYANVVVQNLVFSTLVGLDDTLRPYPDLVESVPTLANGGARFVGAGVSRQLQTTFRLRPGIRWSDGKPLTSRDVAFTCDLVTNSRAGAPADLEVKYAQVDTPDELTIVFVMHSERAARALAERDPARYAGFAAQSGPVVDPLYSLGLNASFVLPEHVLAPLLDGDPRTATTIADVLTRGDFSRRPVGSGPFTVAEWRPGEYIDLVARDDYVLGAPRIPRARFSFAASAPGASSAPNAPAVLEALGRGDLDLVTADALDVTVWAALDALPKTRVSYTLGTTWERLDFNLDHPALKDRRVREALAHAIDRDALAKEVFAGKSAIVESPFPRWSGALGGAARRYEFDPDAARALLASAGWLADPKNPGGPRLKYGQPLSLKLVSTDWSVRMKMGQVLKARLADVGVALEVEHVSADELFGASRGRLARRDFVLALYAWSANQDPALEAAYLFGSASVPTSANGFRGGNYAGYASVGADKLIAAGAATLDPVERGSVYRDLERLLLDDLPTLPLVYVPSVSATSDRLSGYRAPRAPIGETWNVAEWGLGAD